MTPLLCRYCARGAALKEVGITVTNPGALAHVTVHDQRGCVHCCWKHAIWRSTTSMRSGHSTDCAVLSEATRAERDPSE